MKGVLSPVVTAFGADRGIDAQRMLRQCRWLLDNQVGLALFGTNSEGNSLSIQERIDLLDALVAGRFSGLLRQGMAISSTAKRSFVLKPSKRASGNLKQVSITLDENSPVISKVAIEYRDGNRSTIELSQVRMGEKLAGSLFDFKIPPRTDVVRE